MWADLFQILFLLVTVVLLPLLAFLADRRLSSGTPFPRRPVIYMEAVVVQALLTILAFAAAGTLLVQQLTAFPGGTAPLEAAVLFVLAIFGLLLTWRGGTEGRRSRVEALVPITGRQKIAWIGVSFAAGIGEEIAYRGALPSILETWIDSQVAIVIVAALIFGAAHILQGFVSTVIITLFGAALHALVLRTGSLLPAIAVHALYDIAAGFWISSQLPTIAPKSATIRQG